MASLESAALFVPSVVLLGIAWRVGSAMPTLRNNCVKSAACLALLASGYLLWKVFV